MIFDMSAMSTLSDLFAYPDWSAFPPGLVEGQLGSIIINAEMSNEVNIGGSVGAD